MHNLTRLAHPLILIFYYLGFIRRNIRLMPLTMSKTCQNLMLFIYSHKPCILAWAYGGRTPNDLGLRLSVATPGQRHRNFPQAGAIDDVAVDTGS